MPQPAPTNRNIWANVANFIFAILRLGAVMYLTTAPVIVICLLVVEPLRSFPTLIAAFVASTPGIIGAFAAYRDASDLGQTQRYAAGEKAGVIAPSYWRLDAEHALVRPYLRAMRDLMWRALAVTLPLAGAVLIFTFDIFIVFGRSWGVYVIPALAVLAVGALAAWPVALVLVTELPVARFGAILRNAILFAVRRWYFSLFNVAVMGLWFAGMMAQPILVGVFGTPLMWYLVWANARWTITPLLAALDAEEQGRKGRGRR